ncbi:MAG: hypothetical protein JNL74_08330, partial [Fibrobacteres bacterium]|nr:hypothetical protein [Fibrobacterota bacterium]
LSIPKRIVELVGQAKDGTTLLKNANDATAGDPYFDLKVYDVPNKKWLSNTLISQSYTEHSNYQYLAPRQYNSNNSRVLGYLDATNIGIGPFNVVLTLHKDGKQKTVSQTISIGEKIDVTKDVAKSLYKNVSLSFPSPTSISRVVSVQPVDPIKLENVSQRTIPKGPVVEILPSGMLFDKVSPPTLKFSMTIDDVKALFSNKADGENILTKLGLINIYFVDDDGEIKPVPNVDRRIVPVDGTPIAINGNSNPEMTEDQIFEIECNLEHTSVYGVIPAARMVAFDDVPDYSKTPYLPLISGSAPPNEVVTLYLSQTVTDWQNSTNTLAVTSDAEGRWSVSNIQLLGPITYIYAKLDNLDHVPHVLIRQDQSVNPFLSFSVDHRAYNPDINPWVNLTIDAAESGRLFYRVSGLNYLKSGTIVNPVASGSFFRGQTSIDISDVELSSGRLNCYVHQIDAAGNIGNSSKIDLIIDRIKPTVEITGIIDETVFNDVLNFSVKDNSGLDSIYFECNSAGTLIERSKHKIDGSLWTKTLDFKNKPLNAPLEVRVTAIDWAGNISTKNFSLTQKYLLSKKSGVNYYSIGTRAPQPVQITSISGAGPWSVSIAEGTDLSNVKIGDFYKDIWNGMTHSWRISDIDTERNKVTIENSEYDDATYPTPTNNNVVISRAFASVQDWTNARNGNLVQDDRIEKGICYNDGSFLKPNTYQSFAKIGEGSTTDAEHYFWLTAAEGNSHNGTAGTGVTFDCRYYNNPCFYISAPYTVVENLAIKNLNGMYATGIFIHAPNVIVRNNLIYNEDKKAGSRGIHFHGHEGATGSIVYNNMVMNLDKGIEFYIGEGYNGYKEGNLFNNTVYGCNSGIETYVQGGCAGYVYNNLSIGNTVNWTKGISGTLNASNNAGAAGDAIPGTNPITTTVLQEFGSNIPTDLHIKYSSLSRNNGNSSAVSSIVTKDIDGDQRGSFGEWDIGADENTILWADYTWIGAGSDNNWTTAANWQGDKVPGVNDVAIFNAATAKTCNINSNVSVKGLLLDAGWKGTLTQIAGNKLTIGASGITQSDGSFEGTSGIIITSGDIVQTGGSFKSTADTLYVASNANMNLNSGSFIHNSGVIVKTGGAGVLKTGSAQLNNLTFNMMGSLTVADTVTVHGKLHIVNLNSMSDGVINVSGDVVSIDHSTSSPMNTLIRLVGTGVQSIGAGSGILPSIEIAKTSGVCYLVDTLRITGNFTNTNSEVVSGNSTVHFRYATTIKTGNMHFNNLLFNMPGNVEVVNNVNVDGNLDIEHANCFQGGSISVAGNIRTAVTSSSTPMTTIFKIVGSGDQQLGVDGLGGSGIISAIEINKPSGILHIKDVLKVSTGWTWVTGNVDAGTSTVVFGGDTINSGTMSFNNVTINSVGNVTVVGNMDVNGDLTIEKTNAWYGDGFTVAGNVVNNVVSMSTPRGVYLTLDGAGEQTISQVDNAIWMNQQFTVNKPSGRVVLATSFNYPGNVKVISGILEKSSVSNLKITGSFTIDASGIFVSTGSGEIALGSSLVNDGKIIVDGGTAKPGDADAISIVSTVAGTKRTWSGTGSYYLSDVSIKDQNNTTALIDVVSGTDAGNNFGFRFGGGSAIVIAQSIGRNIGSIFNSGKMTLVAGNSAAQLSGAVLPSNVGEGDVLTVSKNGTSYTCYVAEKLNDNTLKLVAPVTVTLSDADYEISRAFNKLQDWEDGGPVDLVSNGIIRKGVCYNDSAFKERLLISDNVTDAGHY